MRHEFRTQIETRARELMRDGMPWIEAHRQADGEFRCGARARSHGGTPCVARPMPGKKRCRHHGGMSTGARTSAGIERLRQASTKAALRKWQPGGCWYYRRKKQPAPAAGEHKED